MTHTELTLTKDHVKAIQRATRLGFKHRNDISEMVVIRDHNDKRDEQTVAVNCAIYEGSKVISPYSKDVRLAPMNYYYAEDLIDLPPIEFLQGFVCEGDTVTAQWYEANNNRYITKSEYKGDLNPLYTKLFRDTLYVQVTRCIHGAFRRHRFLIAESVCADNPDHPNNSVRLCRRGHK